MNAQELRVALQFFPDNAEVLINHQSGVFLTSPPSYDEKNGYVYLDALEQEYNEKDCACGGTGAVPAVIETEENNGYDPCPECTIHFPHNVADGESCIYCGMYYPDGPCPALNHPNRRKEKGSDL